MKRMLSFVAFSCLDSLEKMVYTDFFFFFVKSDFLVLVIDEVSFMICFDDSSNVFFMFLWVVPLFSVNICPLWNTNWERSFF